MSLLTRSKISASLIGRKDSEITRVKKSKSRLGTLNPFFGKGPSSTALDKAAEMSGIKVYVYSADSFTLVNNKPFRSLRSAASILPISPATLPSKLNTGKPFKGFYYFTTPQVKIPQLINNNNSN
ncbi:intron-encoded GIY endonuclease (mitochondrion) [Ustilago bromivora]|uniref:Intron-encoded GIY endonuclease n=1 Tax=Ustilago bromivora TaxID=307758 RepID=A0A1K0GEN4_9BASI|nr:intron-encoded GIY endonuclease [Ustilago bromivora]